MSKNSLGDLLVASRQMVSAAQANKDQLAVAGGSDAFIQRGAETLAALEAADVEQERLKALLKAATAQVDDLQAKLADWHSEATAVVKLSFRGKKEKWVEFGLKAKK